MGNGACGREHLVQFYGGEDRSLVAAVADYLWGALHAGTAAVVIAAPARRSALLTALRERAGDETDAFGERLVLWDDGETLARFVVDGKPSGKLFDASVGVAIRAACERFGGARAYGEMVGRLWSDRSFEAAIALEGLWNGLLDRCATGLYCGYPIDVLSDEFQMGSVGAVLNAHTTLVPSLSPSFDAAMREAMRQVLGDEARGLHAVAQHGFGGLDSAIPPVEATILRLRHTLPRYVDEILNRARNHQQASA